MDRGMRTAVAAGLGLVSVTWAGGALANTTVFGGGMAQGCSQSARAAAGDHPPHAEAIAECSRAIDEELLNRRDLAATYVNRGVLYLTMTDYADARRDFDRAVEIMPGMGEAYVNRGAALIGLERNAEAITQIDQGLALSPDEPEKAYFNRALAKERINDLKGAYSDFQTALTLKPDWDMPRQELTRYSVVTR